MNESEAILYELPHGVLFKVWNSSGKIDVKTVNNFLAEAINHFKDAKSKLGSDAYDDGPYLRVVRNGRKVLGKLDLTYPKPEGLSASLWADAVIKFYCTADTVEQLLESLPDWVEAAKRDGGGMLEILELLKKPGGDLPALAALWKRDAKAS